MFQNKSRLNKLELKPFLVFGFFTSAPYDDQHPALPIQKSVW